MAQHLEFEFESLLAHAGLTGSQPGNGNPGVGAADPVRITSAANHLFADVAAAIASLDLELDSQQAAVSRARAWSYVLAGIGVVSAFILLAMLLTQKFEVGRTKTSLDAVERRLAETRERLTTERRLNLETREALSVASHDLSNPITGLLVASDLLLGHVGHAGDEETAALANEMNRACRPAALLVGDLLGFTRLDAGGFGATPAAFRPGAVARDAIEDVRLWSCDSAISLFDQLQATLSVTADEQRIRAVLRSLLENAVKYGRAPCRLRVDIAGSLVEFHIEDAGPGIPPEEREEIFERFQRGSTSAGRGGTGLELFIARRFAESHGGALTVQQSELGGSDFILRVPVYAEVAARPRLRPSARMRGRDRAASAAGS